MNYNKPCNEIFISDIFDCVVGTTFKETKFAYRHKPTGKWVVFERLGYNVEIYLADEFDTDCLYKARNIIEEDLIRSTMDGQKYAAQNFLEFELVEIEIQYKIKEEYCEIKIHENPTGWPK